MKKIILIAPMPLRFNLTQDQSYLELPFSKVKSFALPLHLATISGLTPERFKVDLWDESIHGPIINNPNLKNYDLAGITGYTAHLPRAKAVAQIFRKYGIPVAIGGAGISTMPQRYRDDFDIFFIGEAELTWPRFLGEWEEGNYRKVYQQVTPVDLSLSPLPRWDSIVGKMQNYYVGCVQTSRGCPFNCEFCDVSYLFGHQFRHKPVDTVLEELSVLEKLGVQKVIFCDDNFAGNIRYTKELLREIITLNNSFRHPLAFAGEASINIAADEELLKLLADANFVEIFTGIESPNKESLKETNKLQNIRGSLIEDIRKIQFYGISVRGSLIVGFDHDKNDIFDQHFKFVQQSNLTVPSIRVLMAPPGTRLWERARKEGRLIKTETEGRYFGNPGTTNIIPKGMSRLELHSGYLGLIERVYDWENFAARVKGFISNVKRKPNVPKQKFQWKRSLQFVYFLFLSLDKKTRGIIIDVIRHVYKQAPFMLFRVMGIIQRQYGYAVRPKLREAIQKQIEDEKSGALKFEVEENEPFISESFKEMYKEYFPEIHKAVLSGVKNKALTDETLFEIFAKFFILRNHSPDALPAGEKIYLMELAQQAIIEKNRLNKIQLSRPVADNEAASNSENARLSDRILKAVEQEILMTKPDDGA